MTCMREVSVDLGNNLVYMPLGGWFVYFLNQYGLGLVETRPGVCILTEVTWQCVIPNYATSELSIVLYSIYIYFFF